MALPRSIETGVAAGVLLALERSRTLALEEAQAAGALRAQELTEREAAQQELARAREAAYEVRRRQIVGGAAFNIQQLHSSHQYAVSQLLQEDAARKVCEQARRHLQEAREQTARRLEELRVVEKVRARRRAERVRHDGRRQQARMDELGLIKASHGSAGTTGEGI